MTRRAAKLATLIVLALSLPLAACGASSERTGGTPRPDPEEPLPEDEFIRLADEICLSGDSRIEAAADDLATRDRRPTPAELRELVDELIVPGLRAEVDAIAALPPPRGSEDEVEAILDATREAVDQIEADPTAVLDGPPPGLREAGRLAREFGSEQCGIQ